jgi:hypothetical protein
MRAVAGRLLAPPEQIDATKTYFSADTWHPLFEAILGTGKFWWPNFHTQTGGGAVGGGCSDKASGAIATATAKLDYTDADSFLPKTVNLVDEVGGTTALSAPDGGWFKCLALDIRAAPTSIRTRIAGNMPNGVIYSLAKSDVLHGDLFQFGTSAIPLATTPVNTFGSYRTWYGPCLIAAMGSKPVAGIIGNSRDDGLTDMASDATGMIGTLPRIFAGVAQVNLSGRGERAQSFAANDIHSAARRQLLPYCTFIALGNTINDTNGGRTGAQAANDNASIETQVGKPTVWCTTNPLTTGGIITPVDLTKDGQRTAYNAAVRAKASYVDPAGVMEVGSSGAWSNEDAVTIDYLHETEAGNKYAAANCAVVGTSLAVHGIAPRAAGAVMPSLGTNLIPNARDATQSSWFKNSMTVPGTTTLDAECQGSAQVVREVAATAQHNIGVGQINKAAAAETYEAWIDLAPVGHDWVLLRVFNQTFGEQANQWFNTTTGALGNVFNTTPSVLAITSASNTEVVQGFRRLKVTFTASAAVTGLWFQFGVTNANADDGGTIAGDVNKGFNFRRKAWLRKVA